MVWLVSLSGRECRPSIGVYLSGIDLLSVLFSIVQSVATLIGGIVIGLAFVWKLALVGLG
jgi:hypothetical protein